MDLGEKYFKNILSSLLLILFIGYFSGITMFPHTHVINGVTITHSHPYTGSPDNPDHTHTSVELNAINLILTFVAVIAVVLGFKSILSEGVHIKCIASDTGISSVIQRTVTLRGPPYTA
ncbi:MAG: hypothetical protein LIO79_00360 [Rikenellaceae bacterium]|nr:hypothetical protein [Rikenellaceae bacterium]